MFIYIIMYVCMSHVLQVRLQTAATESNPGRKGSKTRALSVRLIQPHCLQLASILPVSAATVRAVILCLMYLLMITE